MQEDGIMPDGNQTLLQEKLARHYDDLLQLESSRDHILAEIRRLEQLNNEEKQHA
tara:strand:+ start:997 stop:1161 length:165 start_codon:yes stop_codon:yes gene_type:complete